MRSPAVLISVFAMFAAAACDGDSHGETPDCEADPEVLKLWTCWRCGSDAGYRVVCDDGTIACDPRADEDSSRHEVITIKESFNSSNGCSDGERLKGQLTLGAPRFLVTNRPADLPINVGWAHAPTGDGAEQIIQATLAKLLSLEDLSSGKAIPVDFDRWTPDPGMPEDLFLMVPRIPLSTSGGYRIMLKANTESDDPVVYDMDYKPLTKGTATVVFYTASRPMITEMLYVDDSGGKEFGVYLSEDVVAGDLIGTVTVTVDGAPLSGCFDIRGSCGDGCDSTGDCGETMEIGGQVFEATNRFRVLGADLLAQFNTIIVSLPAAGRGARGTFSDGELGSRYCINAGDSIECTISSGEFVGDSGMRSWLWQPE